MKNEGLIGFGSDNHSAVHPEILKGLLEIPQGHAPSYGTDDLTEQAVQEFRKHFGSDCDVHFVFNGTAANVLCLKALTQSFNSVLCSDVSHLNVDECGAPEALAGCKLIPLASENGKISPESLDQALIRFGDQHFSQVKVLSLTQPTELGTCYSLEELRALIKKAKSHGLKIHLDGARLANACVSLDLSFKEMVTDLGVDALSFGGTKNGLMGAEAVILFGESRNKDFKFFRKQFLQLPSKTRYLSQQFLCYFRNSLWKEIALHSIRMAQDLAAGLSKFELGPKPLYPVESNAVFVKLAKEWVKPLREKYFFYIWDENETIARLMTSFDTKSKDIQGFLAEVQNLIDKTKGS